MTAPKPIRVKGASVARAHAVLPAAGGAVPVLSGTFGLVPSVSATARVANLLVNRASLARRGGALPPSLDEGNKAAIEVYASGLDASASALAPRQLARFVDFIVQGVQETDAEKFFATETFGMPHMFASGRFVQRYIFTGVARATAPNYASPSPAVALPQSVLLRLFYERYLRATLQARRRQYTRVVVDGDYYDGWITTLNLQRSADSEQWVGFTMTMYAFARSGRLDEQATTFLATLFRAAAVESPVPPPAVIDAALAASQSRADVVLVDTTATDGSSGTAERTITLPPSGPTTGDITTGVAVVVPPPTEGAAPTAAVSVDAPPSGVVVTVSETPLRAGERVNVTTTPSPIAVRVDDYAAAFAAADGDGDERMVTVPVVFRPTNGEPATLTLILPLTARPVATISRVSVAAAGQTATATAGRIPPLRAASSVLFAGNAVSVTYTIDVNATGKDVQAPALAGATAQLPDTVRDAATGVTLTQTSLVVTPSANRLTVVVGYKVASSDDLAAEDPFALSPIANKYYASRLQFALPAFQILTSTFQPLLVPSLILEPTLPLREIVVRSPIPTAAFIDYPLTFSSAQRPSMTEVVRRLRGLTLRVAGVLDTVDVSFTPTAGSGVPLKLGFVYGPSRPEVTTQVALVAAVADSGEPVLRLLFSAPPQAGLLGRAIRELDVSVVRAPSGVDTAGIIRAPDFQQLPEHP